MSLFNFTYSKEKSTNVKKYIIPKRIIASSKIQNAECLLKDSERQPVLVKRDTCVFEQGGYVVLDFGSELQGGVDITIDEIIIESKNKTGAYANYGKIRIVFGESVSEAMSTIGDNNGAQNEHSTRDMTVDTSSWSTMRYGNTGFRFVKIEAVYGDIMLAGVKGVLEYKDLDYRGTFRCDDERLNKIFDTAAYTVHLNMQDYVWDGIKRDRLVWIGDLNPELKTICCVFGYDECVEKSLDLARDMYPINSETEDKLSGKIWMSFPSYSCWWIINHRDWYMQNGKKEYLLEQKDYMYKLCHNLISRIDDDGTLSFEDQYFVDWSSYQTPYMEAGFRACLSIGLEAASQIFEVYEDGQMSEKCKNAREKVKKVIPEYSGNKQISAMMSLSGMCDKKDVNAILTENTLEGLSTFYGYYVLEALAKAQNVQGAIDIMRGYWGAMIDLGATTFWEDFDISWIENAGRIDEIVDNNKIDVHTSYGKFCYQKLRHSLCHGWASGPAPFISRHILGVEILEPGCKKIRISPNLGDLKNVKGTFPTPYGVIEIEHHMVNGQIQSCINAPDGVEVVKG